MSALVSTNRDYYQQKLGSGSGTTQCYGSPVATSVVLASATDTASFTVPATTGLLYIYSAGPRKPFSMQYTAPALVTDPILVAAGQCIERRSLCSEFTVHLEALKDSTEIIHEQWSTVPS